MYAEGQLRKVEGWKHVVKIINSKESGVWSEFAKQCGVEVTPTLVAVQDNEVVAKITGSKDMTSEFWQATVDKHRSSDT
jgi:hypothetical protein